jgi:hypothetical protein
MEGAHLPGRLELAPEAQDPRVDHGARERSMQENDDETTGSTVDPDSGVHNGFRGCPHL